jgi:hypothetical protein
MHSRLWLIALGCLLLLNACATIQQNGHGGIGPYAQFSGRLIVIEPGRRWQAVLDWRAHDPATGWMRLTHAASARIIELEWHGENMHIRDNRAGSPLWQPIGMEALAEHGIMLPPATLASILLGAMPPSFTVSGSNEWRGKLNSSFIRLRWQPDARRLTLTDISHGRRAILIIHGP